MDTKGSQTVFDRALLRQHRRRALAREGAPDYLLSRAADDVLDRLCTINRSFPLALEIGSHGATFRNRLETHAASPKIGMLIASDDIEAIARRSGPPALVADAEASPIAARSIDLAVSLLSLHWTNDLPGALIQICNALKPDGLFLGALIGGETLTELRQALYESEIECEGGVSPRVAPFVEVRTLGSLLQRAGFALPVIDLDRVSVTYPSPLALMREVKAMGAGNVIRERKKAPMRRTTLMRAMEIYAERFAAPGGRIRATFDIVHASGWAPAPTQQRPLKPGSAHMRLADALGTEEQSAGEAAKP